MMSIDSNSTLGPNSEIHHLDPVGARANVVSQTTRLRAWRGCRSIQEKSPS